MEIYIGIDKETNKLHLPDSVLDHNGESLDLIWILTYEERLVLTTKENRKLYIFMFLLYNVKDGKFITGDKNLLYFDSLIDHMPK